MILAEKEQKNLKKVTIKKVILIISLFLNVHLNAQETRIIDTTSITFKAKLLTLSRRGITNVKNILDEENKKKVDFLKTKYKSFIFIKINSKDPSYGWYKTKNGCNYYLAYNKEKSKFYRLGGFDIVDINDFFKDLENQEVIIFKDLEEGNEIEEIDIYCLYNYYKMKPKKRLKKGYKCFHKCSKEIITKIGKPH